jgi:hypothetical protein
MENSPPVQRCPALEECGFDALPPGEVLLARRELVERTQLASGPDSAAFNAEVRPTIEAYARFAHLLPASAFDHFVRPGGLLQLSLKVGFYDPLRPNEHLDATHPRCPQTRRGGGRVQAGPGA